MGQRRNRQDTKVARPRQGASGTLNPSILGSAGSRRIGSPERSRLGESWRPWRLGGFSGCNLAGLRCSASGVVANGVAARVRISQTALSAFRSRAYLRAAYPMQSKRGSHLAYGCPGACLARAACGIAGRLCAPVGGSHTWRRDHGRGRPGSRLTFDPAPVAEPIPARVVEAAAPVRPAAARPVAAELVVSRAAAAAKGPIRAPRRMPASRWTPSRPTRTRPTSAPRSSTPWPPPATTSRPGAPASSTQRAPTSRTWIRSAASSAAPGPTPPGAPSRSTSPARPATGPKPGSTAAAAPRGRRHL